MPAFISEGFLSLREYNPNRLAFLRAVLPGETPWFASLSSGSHGRPASRAFNPLAVDGRNILRMIEAGAFYGALATSAAAIFGVGAAVLATRIASLAERAVALRLEAGDYQNQKIEPKEALQASWAENARRSALADLHDVAVEIRRVVALPLSMSVALVVSCLLPLIGWPHDSAAYRLGLVGTFLLAALVWILLVDQLARRLIEVTRVEHEARSKKQTELTAVGEPFIISGDFNALAQGMERAHPEIAATRKGKKTLKRIRKYKRPRL